MVYNLLIYRLSGASVILSGIVKQCPIYITHTNVNGYLIPNFTYKSGEQMEQPGKYGFLRRDSDSFPGWK